jgi:decaprenylphospho-beta-D-erythro-pentofuranosid-2-ulose 2-reductase
METVLVLGATSAIAQATARRFAAAGARLFLVARNPDRLEAVAADLRSRGATEVATRAADLTDPTSQAHAVAAAFQSLGRVDHVLIAHGVLPDSERADANATYARDSLDVNFLSPATLCLHVAPHLEQQRSGCITVIGSVAGDRIRLSNYVYGAAKGGLALFLDGLRTRLQPYGVAVITIKPGQVDTPMTAHMRRGPLFASAETVGAGIHRAMIRGQSNSIYVPSFWRIIMLVIRLVPRPIFRRLPI